MDTLTQGIELLKQGRKPEALPQFQQAVLEQPASFVAHTYLGCTLLDVNQHRAALHEAEQALSINPQYAPAWVLKGRVLKELHRPEEGLVACDRAISYDPRLASAYFYKGIILDSQERLSEALIVLDQALMIDSTFFDALSKKCGILNFLERYQEASPIAERLIKLYPNMSAGWMRRAHILLCMGQRLGEAEQAINQAIQLDPRNPSLLLIKAGIVHDQGRKGEARSLINRANSMNPPHEVQQATEEILRQMNRSRNQQALHVGGTVARVGFGIIGEFIKAIFSGW